LFHTHLFELPAQTLVFSNSTVILNVNSLRKIIAFKNKNGLTILEMDGVGMWGKVNGGMN
jgi:hypothetical protein